jgi:hypothetical protein
MMEVVLRARLSSPKDAYSAAQIPMSYTKTFSMKRLSAGTMSESRVDTPAKEKTKSKIFLVCPYFVTMLMLLK